MKASKLDKSYFGLRFLATGKETNGKYFFSKTTIPAGDIGPPMHVHSKEDESFYIKSGEVIFSVDGREFKLGRGSFLTVEKGEKHSWRNDTKMDAELLVIFAPAGIENMFVELENNMSQIKEIGLKYGTYFEI